MKAYKLSVTVAATGVKLVCHAGSQTEVREKRQAWVDKHNVKKSDVVVTEVDVPTSKDCLLNYLNKLTA